MKKLLPNIAFFLLLFIIPANAAVPGDVDSSFGSKGKVIVGMLENATGSGGFKAIIAPDHKIYQFGSTSDNINTSRCAILRLKKTGKIDEEFNGNGKLVCNFPELSFTRFMTGAVQTDGKVLGVGAAVKDGLNYALIARFLPDGAVDQSFGTNGYSLLRVSGVQINYYWSAIAVRSDGRIIVAGALDYQMAAARFLPNGSIDPGFGTNGYKIIQVDLLGELWDMKLLPNESVILAGKCETSFNDGNLSDFVIVKLTPDGEFDGSFAQNGIKRFDLTPNTDSDAEILQSISVLPDGKFLAFGRIGDNFVDSVVIKLLPTGEFDPAFGTNGVQLVDYEGQSNVPQDMAVQDDGKIVLASLVQNNFLIQRLLARGEVDKTFGDNGSIVTDLGGRDRPYSVSLSDNKILVAGYAFGQNGIPRQFALIRYFQNAPNTAPLRGRLVNFLGRGIPDGTVYLSPADDSQNRLTITTDNQGYFESPATEIGIRYILTPTAPRCYFTQNEILLDFNGKTSLLIRANCFRVIK